MKQVNMEKTPKSKFFGYKTKHAHKNTNQFQTWFDDDTFDDDDNIKNSSPIGTPESVSKTPVQSFSAFSSENNACDVYNSSPQFRVGWNEGSAKISCEMSSPVNIRPVRRRIRRCPDNVASKVLSSASAISIKKEESDCDIQHCINLAKRLLESTAHPVTEESVDVSNNEVTNEMENIKETNDNIDLLDDSSNELMILCSQAIEESVSKTRSEKHSLTPEHHSAKRFKENSPAPVLKIGTNEGNRNEPNKRNLFKSPEVGANQPSGHRTIMNASKTGTNEVTTNESNKRNLFKCPEVGVNQPGAYRTINNASKTGTNEAATHEPNKRSLFKYSKIDSKQSNDHQSVSYTSKTGANEVTTIKPNKQSLCKYPEKGVNQPNGHRNIFNHNCNDSQRKNNSCNTSVTNSKSNVNPQMVNKVNIHGTPSENCKIDKLTSSYGTVSNTVQDDMDSFLDGEDDLFSSVDFNFLDSIQNNTVEAGPSNSKIVDLPKNIPLVKSEPVKPVVKYTKEQIEQRRMEASLLRHKRTESVKSVPNHQIEQRRVEASVLLVKKPEPVNSVSNLVVKYTKEQIEQRRIEAKKRLLFNKKHRSM